jgi:hypothetical protein
MSEVPLYTRPQSSGIRVQESGLKVQGAGFRVQSAGFKVQSARFRVQSSGFMGQGSGFRVKLHLLIHAHRLSRTGRANMAHIRQSRPDSGLT